MRFEKNSLVVEVNNPVCESLFLRQGWIPAIQETEKIEVEVKQEIKTNKQAQSNKKK